MNADKLTSGLLLDLPFLYDNPIMYETILPAYEKGEIITTLASDYYGIGQHLITFDGSNLVLDMNFSLFYGQNTIVIS